MSKKLNIGIFGFGVVGQGLYDIIKTKHLNLEILQFVIKDATKKRSLPQHLFSTDKNSILQNPEINTVVEMINDADAAFEIVSAAMKAGKNVVSASKKMIAEHLSELLDLQHQYGTSLLYEGAVCGSIPIIRNLEEYYDNELLHSVYGIFNGSSNYILSKGFNDGLNYASALKQAQDLGYAETDPTSDVGGFDAKYKLLIAAYHAYGIVMKPEDIFNFGIENITVADIQYAKEKELKIKLVPYAQKINNKQIVMYVLPRLVSKRELLYNVDYEYNGVIVQAAFADQQFFFGKGAGGHPTGSAVLSDITALRYDYHYEYKKAAETDGLQFTNDTTLEVYLRYNQEDLPQTLAFEYVKERFYSDNFKFITGKIKLQNLITHQHRISQDNAFIAVVSQI